MDNVLALALILELALDGPARLVMPEHQEIVGELTSAVERRLRIRELVDGPMTPAPRDA